MNDRKTISVDADVFDRLNALKHDDESWTEFGDRVADVLETASGDDEHTVNTLTEDHIPDIAGATARETADILEERPRGR